jgi:hypothetical protein
MVSPERASQIADQVQGVVQKAGFDAATTTRKLAQSAANEVNARFVRSRTGVRPKASGPPASEQR